VPTAVSGFVGLNGSGKSLAIMQLKVLVALLKGRHVLSNVPLTPEKLWPSGMCGKAKIGSWSLLTGLDQIAHVERGTLVVLDDVSAVFPARGWGTMPAGIHVALQTLRHLGAELCWSAPTWERVDLTVREVTQEVWQCKSFMHAGGLWGRARFVIWKQWEVSRYLSGASKSAPGKVRCVRFVKARNLYNTEAVIEPFIHLDAEGVCIGCGGKRVRPECRCGEYREAKMSPAARVRHAAKADMMAKHPEVFGLAPAPVARGLVPGGDDAA
jgi:Zonular occludens toxin (Zot)